MKCQKRGCPHTATHCTMEGEHVTGFFCRIHCYELVSSNWAAKIETSVKARGIKSLKEFDPKS